MAQNDSAMTVFETVSDHHHHHSPGSIAKDWNVDELETCGAVGTNLHAPFDLDGEVHPIFHTWIIPTEDGSDDDNSSAIAHALHQPLILASRILESAGLPWLSEFCIDDIFSPSYPGRNAARKPGQHDEDGPSPLFEPCYETPDVIVRHHRAAWATPRLRQTWLASTAHELRTTLPRHVQWQLDADIFKTSGWVGYTCRHPHGAGKRDHPDTISAADEDAKRQGATGRLMTVLVMKEYVSRLCELRRTGRFGGEEYMLTAFMAAVTLLHELGHVIYWRDFRAVNRRMTEPYFGGDLEMELGDSFVASIFGGWVPVPISLKDHDFRNHGTFACGLAWRQHLTWDYHRARPKHRAHYSIPVTYVAALFNNGNWRDTSRHGTLIRPSTLPAVCSASCHSIGMDTSVLHAGLHAPAAIPDFVDDEEGGCRWRHWKQRPAADFRIPLYRGIVIGRHDGGSPIPSRWLVPDEPDVCDKVLSRVQIRLPSSVAASTGDKMAQMVSEAVVLDIGQHDANGLGAGLDLRKMTGDGLRRSLARALDLPLKHVKLCLEETGDGSRGLPPGDEPNEVLGPCVLSAYAKRQAGDGLALSLFLELDQT